MASTSQVRPSDAVGEVTVERWQGSNLLKPSAIKPVIATIEQRLVIRTLERLSGRDQTALRKVLGIILG
jgi:mRNA interferase MazF